MLVRIVERDLRYTFGHGVAISVARCAGSQNGKRIRPRADALGYTLPARFAG